MTNLYDDFPTAAQCVAAKWQRKAELREQATQFLNGPVRTELINSAHACTWIRVPFPDAVAAIDELPFTTQCQLLLRDHGYKDICCKDHALELHWA
jgi:hypothetical protein